MLQIDFLIKAKSINFDLFYYCEIFPQFSPLKLILLKSSKGFKEKSLKHEMNLNWSHWKRNMRTYFSTLTFSDSLNVAAFSMTKWKKGIESSCSFHAINFHPFFIPSHCHVLTTARKIKRISEPSLQIPFHNRLNNLQQLSDVNSRYAFVFHNAKYQKHSTSWSVVSLPPCELINCKSSEKYYFLDKKVFQSQKYNQHQSRLNRKYFFHVKVLSNECLMVGNIWCLTNLIRFFGIDETWERLMLWILHNMLGGWNWF